MAIYVLLAALGVVALVWMAGYLALRRITCQNESAARTLREQHYNELIQQFEAAHEADDPSAIAFADEIVRQSRLAERR